MTVSKLSKLMRFLESIKEVNNKSYVASTVSKEFNLTKDRSVYYCKDFALRFSISESESFSNTVLSLSALQKYDEIPFIVVLITPKKIYCLLANTTLLKKISHSSQQLRENNIKGSFNGSDILRSISGIANNQENLEKLFAIHQNIGFLGNLPRLVEATTNISPSGKRFEINSAQAKIILKSSSRASDFLKSEYFHELKKELDSRVNKFKNEILLAALIENVNVRGRIIEYLIAGEDKKLQNQLINALQNKNTEIPQFKTENTLGDFEMNFPSFTTQTDVKTKIMVLHSNPKAYNIDKMLEFLSEDDSVFLFYFVGLEPVRIVNTVLLSMFQEDLMDSTILLKHWAGRNSRGVTQFDGNVIHELIVSPKNNVNEEKAVLFLKNMIDIS
jgi:hypothetical protein